jgi:xanthine/uracil/vitamin C permease (AzgA family)
VIAPTTSTSLYYEIFLLNNNVSKQAGNFAIMLVGVAFLILSIRKVAVFVSNLVPFVLKAGICLGVGLLIALDALTSIHLVESGRYTITDMGTFTSKIWISILSFVIIALLMSRRVKGAFFMGIVFGSTIYWAVNPGEWPSELLVKASDFAFAVPIDLKADDVYNVFRLVGDLLFIGKYCFKVVCPECIILFYNA